jgi:hypothetical protein
VPTIPSERAQIAGAKTLEVPPIRTCADITDQKVGRNAISNAPAANATITVAINARFDRRRSASAPAGVWVRISAMPPTVRAIPTRCSFHPYPARDRVEWSGSRLYVGEKEI